MTVSLDKLVDIAREIAFRAHAGQHRRDGVTPYTDHLCDVVIRLKRRCGSVTPEMKAVAWLHDVLEDTDITPALLQSAGFGLDVVTAVLAMTKRPDEEYADYLMGVAANPIARQVKIADMLSNLSDDPTDEQILKYSKGLHYLLEVQHGREPVHNDTGTYADPEWDDASKACPDCETPNQFGELCPECRAARADGPRNCNDADGVQTMRDLQ